MTLITFEVLRFVFIGSILNYSLLYQQQSVDHILDSYFSVG